MPKSSLEELTLLQRLTNQWHRQWTRSISCWVNRLTWTNRFTRESLTRGTTLTETISQVRSMTSSSKPLTIWTLAGRQILASTRSIIANMETTAATLTTLSIQLKSRPKSQRHSDRELNSQKLWKTLRCSRKSIQAQLRFLTVLYLKTLTGGVLEAMTSQESTETRATVDLAILFHLRRLPKIDLRSSMGKTCP